MKVPSDPAQVITGHASFRVRLGRLPQPPGGSGVEDSLPGAGAATAGAAPVSTAAESDTETTIRLPIIPSLVRSSSGQYTTAADLAAAEATPAGEPRRPGPARTGSIPTVMWSGKTAPGDSAAAQLLETVRTDTRPGRAAGFVPRPAEQDEHDPAEYGESAYGPSPAGSREDPLPNGPLADFTDLGELSLQQAPDAGDHGGGPDPVADTADTGERPSRRARAAHGRRAWYSGRGRNPGLVLLPLRAFLGGVSVYAGLSKLCDPKFFDGSSSGSMGRWLSSLEPWAVAAPLHDFAVRHPVGSGLFVAFLQIIAGMLTVLGLWQRVAAGIGAALSAALLVTVSWRSAPVYDVPDIVYLAAWSPLVIAGAPVYSLDSRLATEAWRRLGPHAALSELRRWALCRGAMIVTVVIGLSLLIGSALSGAVRATSHRTDLPDLPAPSPSPADNPPGKPLPSRSEEPAGDDSTRRPERPKTPTTTPLSPQERTTSRAPRLTPGGTPGGGGSRPERGGGSPVTRNPRPSSPTKQPQPPEPPPSDEGALGGILGAGSPSDTRPQDPSDGGNGRISA